MRKKASLVPAVVLLGALFMVLPSRSTGREVALRNFRFDPVSLRVPVGTAVTFSNDTDTTHDVTCRNCPRDAGDIQPGMSKTLTFADAGEYLLLCRYHADRGMGMRLTVGDAATAPSPAPPTSSPSP